MCLCDQFLCGVATWSEQATEKKKYEATRHHFDFEETQRQRRTHATTTTTTTMEKKNQTIIKRDTANDQPNLLDDAFMPKTEVAFLARGRKKRTHTRSVRIKKLKLIFVYREEKNSNSRKGKKTQSKTSIGLIAYEQMPASIRHTHFFF